VPRLLRYRSCCHGIGPEWNGWRRFGARSPRSAAHPRTEAVSWKQIGPVTADVTVRGDVVDLLVLVVGRVELGEPRLAVTGDTELLVHWCAHVKF
jgi:hypothetical protein